MDFSTCCNFNVTTVCCILVDIKTKLSDGLSLGILNVRIRTTSNQSRLPKFPFFYVNLSCMM